jgi:hypothetical protein
MPPITSPANHDKKRRKRQKARGREQKTEVSALSCPSVVIERKENNLQGGQIVLIGDDCSQTSRTPFVRQNRLERIEIDSHGRQTPGSNRRNNANNKYEKKGTRRRHPRRMTLFVSYDEEASTTSNSSVWSHTDDADVQPTEWRRRRNPFGKRRRQQRHKHDLKNSSVIVMEGPSHRPCLMFRPAELYL